MQFCNSGADCVKSPINTNSIKVKTKGNNLLCNVRVRVHGMRSILLCITHCIHDVFTLHYTLYTYEYTYCTHMKICSCGCIHIADNMFTQSHEYMSNVVIIYST